MQARSADFSGDAGCNSDQQWRHHKQGSENTAQSVTLQCIAERLGGIGSDQGVEGRV